MFVLDTNILSALMSARPAPEVAAWLDGQPEASLFTTSIARAEILAGVAILPAGHRRRALEAAATAIFDEEFGGRVLAFDDLAAASYAEIFAQRRRDGRPVATLDLMIAAIAHSHSAGVVTRDVGGFEGCGVPVVNPWGA